MKYIDPIANDDYIETSIIKTMTLPTFPKTKLVNSTKSFVLSKVAIDKSFF